MAGILIAMLPAVTEAIGVVGGGVAELTGSQILGSAASGAIASGLATEANSLITSGVDSIFGQGTTSGIEDKANKAFEDLKKMGYFTNETDAKQIVKNLIPKDINVKQEVGNYITEIGNTIKKNPEVNPSDIIKNVSQSNPFFYYLGTQLLEFTSNFVIPDNELYKQIESVYDANNFYDKLTSFENNQYSFIDEVGNKVYWDLYWNTYTVIPPLFGTYVGYSSPNNDFPVRYTDENGRLRESVLDSIAMGHDMQYKTIGLFSRFADYVLISRIQATKDKMILPNEREVANVAVNYFSTIGNLMRKMFGTEENTESLIKGIYKEIKGIDIPDEQIAQEFTEVASNVYSGQNNELVNFINNMEIQIN